MTRYQRFRYRFWDCLADWISRPYLWAERKASRVVWEGNEPVPLFV